jgi:hypothetical protein
MTGSIIDFDQVVIGRSEAVSVYAAGLRIDPSRLAP